MNYVSLLVVLCGMMLTAPMHVSAADGITTGDLISGSSPAVYYVGSDGKRYAFPSARIYFTWYDDFSGVKTVSDTTLASFQLGGNVTYRPGIRLVKIESDPKVYAVDNGVYLRWISTEALAEELYGSSWNTMVDDIPVAFFGDYIIGPQIQKSQDFNANLVKVNSTDIDDERTRWKQQRLQTIADLTTIEEEEESVPAAAPAPASITLQLADDATTNKVVLRWLSVGLVDFHHFNLYKDSDQALTRLFSGNYTDIDVTADTTYQYHVIAFNGKGDTLATSNSLSVTTPEN